MDEKEKILMAYAMMCKNACDTESVCEIAKMAVGYDCTECQIWIAAHPKETVKAIEKWEAENPVKTRQDVFLEQYPNVKIDKYAKTIDINPCTIDSQKYVYKNAICKRKTNCLECRREYWWQAIAE